MTTVLRILRHTDIVSGRPALKAYQERCEARPAFQKAMADHHRLFEASASTLTDRAGGIPRLPEDPACLGIVAGEAPHGLR